MHARRVRRGRVANLPGPEERVLQAVHVRKLKLLELLLELSGPGRNVGPRSTLTLISLWTYQWRDKERRRTRRS